MNLRKILLTTFLPAAIGLVQGCESREPCPDDLHSYKGKCLSSTAVEYVSCTEGRGFSTIDEWGAGVGGNFKSIAGASVTFAKKKADVEDTPVALEIVKACLEISKNSRPANDPVRNLAGEFQQQTDQLMKLWQEKLTLETPAITLSANKASRGEAVTVIGSNFWPNETVEVRVHAAPVASVKADSKGNFSVVVTVPSDLTPGFSTRISATGKSSVKSASSPFQAT